MLEGLEEQLAVSDSIPLRQTNGPQGGLDSVPASLDAGLGAHRCVRVRLSSLKELQ